ncbi:type II toxin-antitoxin system VapC family toxin [Methyloglobulus sp.]|uniref:type II toxin-antitoxin system VapC family toxin n=1 Tax=Methyloglobulus sp. TaxID=2518622 RepID=UPI0032B85940
MKRYLLDTNIVSHLIKEHPVVSQRIVKMPMASLGISVITEAELYYGLAKRPEAKRLHLVVEEFLKRVDVLPWDSAIVKIYGIIRAEMERQGKTLAPLDHLIAAHALSIDAVLVTNDKAFYQVGGLTIEDWTN